MTLPVGNGRLFHNVAATFLNHLLPSVISDGFFYQWLSQTSGILFKFLNSWYNLTNIKHKAAIQSKCFPQLFLHCITFVYGTTLKSTFESAIIWHITEYSSFFITKVREITITMRYYLVQFVVLYTNLIYRIRPTYHISSVLMLYVFILATQEQLELVLTIWPNH